MTGCLTCVTTGSMDVSVHPGGGASVTEQSADRVMNTLCVPPPSGKVSVVVNGGVWPCGSCCELTPSVGGRIPSPPTGTQFTTTSNVVPGAGPGAGVPVTTFVTSSCAQLATRPSCAGW